MITLLLTLSTYLSTYRRLFSVVNTFYLAGTVEITMTPLLPIQLLLKRKCYTEVSNLPMLKRKEGGKGIEDECQVKQRDRVSKRGK